MAASINSPGNAAISLSDLTASSTVTTTSSPTPSASSKGTAAATNPLNDLPQDKIVEIFKHLNIHDLSIASRVSKGFNAISKDDMIWEEPYQNLKANFYGKEQDISDKSKKNYQDSYKNLFESAREFIFLLPQGSLLLSKLFEEYKKDDNLFSEKVIKEYLSNKRPDELVDIFTKAAEIGCTPFVKAILKIEGLHIPLKKALISALGQAHSEMVEVILQDERIKQINPRELSDILWKSMTNIVFSKNFSKLSKIVLNKFKDLKTYTHDDPAVLDNYHQAIRIYMMGLSYNNNLDELKGIITIDEFKNIPEVLTEGLAGAFGGAVWSGNLDLFRSLQNEIYLKLTIDQSSALLHNVLVDITNRITESKHNENINEEGLKSDPKIKASREELMSIMLEIIRDERFIALPNKSIILGQCLIEAINNNDHEISKLLMTIGIDIDFLLDGNHRLIVLLNMAQAAFDADTLVEKEFIIQNRAFNHLPKRIQLIIKADYLKTKILLGIGHNIVSSTRFLHGCRNYAADGLAYALKPITKVLENKRAKRVIVSLVKDIAMWGGIYAIAKTIRNYVDNS